LVEPGDELLAKLAILESLVELLADGQREAGDFAVARHRRPPERSLVFMLEGMITGMRQD
jgi:hypothetical protein